MTVIGPTSRRGIPSEAEIGLIGGVLEHEDLVEDAAVQPARAYAETVRGAVAAVAKLARQLQGAPEAARHPARTEELVRSGQASLIQISSGPEAKVAGLAIAGALESVQAELGKDLATVENDVGAVTAAAQVRDRVARLPEGSRLQAVMDHMDDKTVLRAVLSAPALASGLERDQLAALRDQAESRHHPELVRRREILKRAHEGLLQAASVATRAVAEMAGLRRDPLTGEWRARGQDG